MLKKGRFSFVKGETSRDAFVEENVISAAVSVIETQLAEENKVDFRDGVNAAIENSNRPGGSTNTLAVWFAGGPGRLQVAGVKGVGPVLASLVRAVVVLKGPFAWFKRVARDVVTVTENLLPVVRISCHVACADNLHVVSLVKHPVPRVASQSSDSVGC